MVKFRNLSWWKITLAIIIVIIINKSIVYILPNIESEKYTMPWFAAKIPYASLRMFFTLALAYFFIDFKNIVGWKKFKWYFLIFIPLLYILIRPGLIDYSKLELSSTTLALIAMVIGVAQEELFSRGIVYTHLKKKSNGFIAILLSSIIFGLLHHSFTGIDAFSIDSIIGDSLAPFILGLIFGTIYHFSKSLPLVIILHLIWNTVSLFSMASM